MRTWIPSGERTGMRTLLGVLLLGLALSLGACYPGSVDNAAELDLVLTNHDPDFDFTSIQTYASPDSLIDIAALLDPDSEGNIDLTKAQQQQIIAWIDAELASRGYQKVGYEQGDPNPPDFFMLPGVIKSTTVVVGGGWGCYPYWGWYGCGYYPWCCSYAYSYDSGTLLVNLVQPSADSDTTYTVRWSGALNGVISTSVADVMARIESGIGQMFAQSPYLTANQPESKQTDAVFHTAKRGVR